METILEKDENNKLIPLIKNEETKKNFELMYENLKNKKINEIFLLTDEFQEIIKQSPEIIQMILDFNEIHKIKDEGIIEILIEKYLEETMNQTQKEKIEEFFKSISNPFQIGKNIYDFIYQKVGKIFHDPIILETEKWYQTYEKCIDLLTIFYSTNNKNNETFKEYFFYLCDNEFKFDIKEDNKFNIDEFINFNLFIYVNDFYKNNDVIISKIIFNENEELLIKLKNKFEIQVLYNNTIVENIDENNSFNLNKDKWNFIKIKIQSNEILIEINEKKINIKTQKKLIEILDLIFFSKFQGLVSSIIVSDNDLENIEYFSKKYIKKLLDEIQLFEVIKEKKNKINENKLNESKKEETKQMEEDNNEDEDLIKTEENNKEENCYFTFIAPVTYFYKKKKYNELTTLYIKNDFPFFYSFDNQYYKENIFLIGGIKNILPLFEILIKFFDKEANIELMFTKIIELLSIILSFDNNIEDANVCNFFQIFLLFLEKVEQYNENYLIKTQKFFESLFKTKKNFDIVFNNMKRFILKENLMKIIFKKEVKFINILINLEKTKNDAFKFLINFVLENNNKNFEEIFDEIFDFFYIYLFKGHTENLNEIFNILEKKNIDQKIIDKSLQLIIKILKIDEKNPIYQKMLNKHILNIEKNISSTFYLGFKIQDINSNQEKKKDKKEKEGFLDLMSKRIKNQKKNQIEIIFEGIKNNFEQILNGNLLNILEQLSQRKELSTKLNIIFLFQIIQVYFPNNIIVKDKNNKNEKEVHNSNNKINTDEIEKEKIQEQKFYKNLTEIEKPKIPKSICDDEKLQKELIIDFIHLLQTFIKFNYNEEDKQLLINYKNEVFILINKILELARTSFYLPLIITNIENARFFNIYHSASFNETLISLYYHLFLLKEKEKNDEILQIKQKIRDNIYDLFYDGMYYGLTPFILLLSKLNHLINSEKNNKDNKKLEVFLSDFFKDLQNLTFLRLEETNSQDINENKDNPINRFRELIKVEKNDDIKTFYGNIKSQYKTITKHLSGILTNYQNLDYLIIKKFLPYFEMMNQNKPGNKMIIKEIISINVFCIILYVNKEFHRLSKSPIGSFFIRLPILSIECALSNITNDCKESLPFVKIASTTIALFYFLVFESQSHFSFNPFRFFSSKKDKIEYPENLKTKTQNIYKLFNQKEIKFKDIHNVLISDNYIEVLNFIKVGEPEEIMKFPDFLKKHVFSQNKKKSQHNIKNEGNEMTIFRKFSIEKNYRKIKKSLFSWNNSYSNHKLFYTEEGKKTLKYKILNHYSDEMIQPILVPILNINSYIPSNLKIMFQEKYKCFDLIGESLFDENYEELRKNNKISDSDIINYLKINDKNIISCCLIKQGLHIPGFIIKKTSDFNFIGFPREMSDIDKFYCDGKKDNICHGSLRKYNKFYYLNIRLDDIVTVYKRNYAFKDDSLEIFTKQNKSYYFEITNLINIDNNELEKNIDNTPTSTPGTDNKSYYIVNPEFETVKFTLDNNVNESKNIEESKCEETELLMGETKTDEIVKKKTFHKKNIVGKLEIRRNNFFNYITKYNKKEEKDIRYFYKGKYSFYKNKYSIMETFYKNGISKLEFLMRLNLLANRSFKDLNQYPVFPWILSDYSNFYNKEEKIININDLLKQNSIYINKEIKNLRDLKYPMGKLGKKRFESYKSIYDISVEEFKEDYGINEKPDFSEYKSLQEKNINIQLIPVYFGTHYSNPAYVCHYLTRIFPYSTSALLIQGDSFDAPDRLFINLARSYFSAENTKCDLRELIPELYYLPELFRNINHLNLGYLQENDKPDSTYSILKNKYNYGEEIRVENVLLPFWCENNPEKFISVNREIFERQEIKINDWIDIIFGYAQKGPEALERCNIFSPYCYEGFIDLEKLDNLDDRELNIRFFELGVNPSQLFRKPMKKQRKKVRKIIIDNKEEIEDLKENIQKLLNNKLNFWKKEITGFKEEIKNLSEGNNYDLSDNEEKKNEKLKNLNTQIENRNNLVFETESFMGMINTLKSDSRSFKNKIFTFYNFYDGKIFVYTIKKGEDSCPLEIRQKKNRKFVRTNNLDNSEITAISIDYSYIIYGTKLGSLIFYKNGQQYFEKIIHNHVKKILDIYHNITLHLTISSSEDGYINIYKMPDAVLINSIYDCNFFADRVFISNSPLPSFIIYNNNNKIFRVYSINGRKIREKEIDNVNDINIGRDENFIEYLRINNSMYYKLPFLDKIEYEEVNLEADNSDSENKNENITKGENKEDNIGDNIDKEENENEIDEKNND